MFRLHFHLEGKVRSFSNSPGRAEIENVQDLYPKLIIAQGILRKMITNTNNIKMLRHKKLIRLSSFKQLINFLSIYTERYPALADFQNVQNLFPRLITA